MKIIPPCVCSLMVEIQLGSIVNSWVFLGKSCLAYPMGPQLVQ
jgi:hypothetical protein